MIEALILFSICFIAVVRPLWGLAILLISECSIFYLGQFATVKLPLGYCGPSDVFIVYLFIGSFFRSIRRHPQSKYIMNGLGGSLSRLLLSAILPYLIWLAIFSLLGAISGFWKQSFTVQVRQTISFILPWSVIAIVWFMRDRAKEILKMVIFVASVTALVHLAIQLLDYRPIMYAAYWRSAVGIGEYQQYILDREVFTRGLPQGIMLMLFCLIYCFSRYIIGSGGRQNIRLFLLLYFLQFMAIGITFTRSLMFTIIAGCVLAVAIAARMSILSNMAKKRIAALIVLSVTFCIVLAAVSPNIIEFWVERINLLSDDRTIYTENTIRGMDNLAAISAISDRPFWGWGEFAYPDAYSLRATGSTDIHPLLQLGLVGGIPCILLFIRLLWVLLRKFWIYSRSSMDLRKVLLPYLTLIATALLVINTIGAGGTTSGSSLISFALFIGLMVAEVANSARKCA